MSAQRYATYMQSESTTGHCGACGGLGGQAGGGGGGVCPLCASTVPEKAIHGAEHAHSQQHGSHTCKQLFALSETESALHVLPVFIDHEVAVLFIHLQANQRLRPGLQIIFCHSRNCGGCQNSVAD